MSTPGAIKRFTEGAWAQEGSYILTVPEVADLPGTPEDDDVFAWASAEEALHYSRAGAWLPFEAGGGDLGLPHTVERFAVGLSGTIPTSGDIALGTINVPARPYERLVVATAYMLTPGAAATIFSLAVVAGATQFIGRGPGSGSLETVTVAATDTLAANTALTVTARGSIASGTATAAAIINDARFCRMDVMVYPVEPTRAVSPGGGITFETYTKATGVQSWLTGMDTTASAFYAVVINGQWCQMVGQLISTGTFTTGAFNATLLTLVPALRPTFAGIHGSGIIYNAYSPCRITVSAAGGFQILHNAMPASQTQIFANIGWPLYS